MRNSELHGIAQNLAAMSVSSRIAGDLETLAALPGGPIRVDLTAGKAKNANGEEVSLQLGSILWSWLKQQSAERGLDLGEIEIAEVQIDLNTSRIPTNRDSIVSFDLRAVATLTRGDREYKGEAANHIWHDRTPSKRVQPTCEDARGDA